MFDKEKIKEIIPYDEPFLFVDEVENIYGDAIYGSYQTSKSDSYFKGHFVGFPIMPGVLIMEALAQLSTILLRQKIGRNHKEHHFLAYNVRKAQFYKPIFPGDKILLQARVNGIRERKIAIVQAKASVNEDLKCETVFSVAIIRKDEFERKYPREKSK
ncbi:MAG: hypothetical protein PVF96_08255 [Candidatus Bathyarchaeota archaeon]